jgi:hypothetical protein
MRACTNAEMEVNASSAIHPFSKRDDEARFVQMDAVCAPPNAARGSVSKHPTQGLSRCGGIDASSQATCTFFLRAMGTALDVPEIFPYHRDTPVESARSNQGTLSCRQVNRIRD